MLENVLKAAELSFITETSGTIYCVARFTVTGRLFLTFICFFVVNVLVFIFTWRSFQVFSSNFTWMQPEPDYRQKRSGETFPLLCFRIYPQLCVRVAAGGKRLACFLLSAHLSRPAASAQVSLSSRRYASLRPSLAADACCHGDAPSQTPKPVLAAGSGSEQLNQFVFSWRFIFIFKRAAFRSSPPVWIILLLLHLRMKHFLSGLYKNFLCIRGKILILLNSPGLNYLFNKIQTCFDFQAVSCCDEVHDDVSLQFVPLV